MPTWSQQYAAQLTKLSQRPIYLAVLCKSMCMLSSSGRTGITAAATTIEIDSDHDVSALPGDTAIIWDADGFETVRIERAVTGASDFTLTVTRATNGTTAKAFGVGAGFGVVLGMASTATVSGLDSDYFNGAATFPTGGGVSVDYRTGRTKADSASIEIQDWNQQVTRLFPLSPFVGEFVIILGGYEGMPFDRYSFLHTGTITGLTFREGSVYQIDIGSPIERMARKLFTYFEEYSDTLSGAMTAGQTTLPCDESLIPYTNDKDTDTTLGLFSALYVQVDNEVMRITSGGNAQGVSFTVNIARGKLGTTAATHSQGAAITLFFAVEDYHIDILLGLLLTQPSSSHPGYAGTPDYAWADMMDDTFGDAGLGFTEAEVDITSFETIRDNWFPTTLGRLEIDRGEQMRPFFEKHLLAPFGLCIVPDNTGRLALTIIRPQFADEPVTLTSNDIVGVPTIDIDNSELINDVTLHYDYTRADNDFGSLTRVVDETSVDTYSTNGVVELDGRTVNTAITGTTIPTRLARKKRRYFNDPNPVVPLEVLYVHAGVNVGDVVHVTHGTIINRSAGTLGVTSRPMAVVGRYPNWSAGTLHLDLIDTSFYGKRFGLVSPTGSPDYTSATTTQKARYGFIGATGTNYVNNGSEEGYSIT